MSATVMAEEARQREARLRTRFAATALAAAVLLMAAAIVALTGPHTNVSEQTLALIYIHKRGGLDLLDSILSLFGSVAIAFTLVFLFDAAKARNPQTSGFVRWLAIIGAGLAGVSGVIYTIVLSNKASTFVSTGTQTYPEAHAILSSGGVVALQLLGLLGTLLIAMAIVLVSLQAMRVGLLTRFMGYLGMLAGALVLFQITPVPIVEAYWFGALAVLFLGRWPTGEPPAWRSGKAEPWPSGQSLREQRIRAAGGAQPRGGRAGRAAADGSKQAAPRGKATATADLPASTPRTSQKRKRKRRR